MNILILGASGFIGTNLAIALSRNKDNNLTLADAHLEYFKPIVEAGVQCQIVQLDFFSRPDLDSVVRNQDIVYHLSSSNIPTTSNRSVSEEITVNVQSTLNLLDSCVREKVKKVIFISSGGTVYGKQFECPLSEDTATYPITSYGLQKITIEKMLYLYEYTYGLDYRVLRLSNPYGPYQRPNGKLGAVTTFTYKAINGYGIEVYGDGSVVRDYIYIDDAIEAVINIAEKETKYKTYNVGSGKGKSINEIIELISKALSINPSVIYKDARKVDVPINYLDVSRYENEFGKLSKMDFIEGVKKTAEFLREKY